MHVWHWPSDVEAGAIKLELEIGAKLFLQQFHLIWILELLVMAG